MNGVAAERRASSRAAVSSAPPIAVRSRPPRWLGTGGRGRSAGRSRTNGAPASASRQ